MRTMFDAVTARNIPAGAQLVAGYGDTIKIPQWTPSDWALFPNAIKVVIVKKATTNAGNVLDVEKGDATPAEAPGWVVMRRAAGADPTVYCNASTWPAVRAAFAAARVGEPHYWIAEYDGDPTIPAGAVAKQYADGPKFDTSSVADSWPGVDPAIATPEKEDTMLTFDLAAGQNVRDCIPIPVDRLVRLTMCADADATFNSYGWVAPDGGNGFGETNVVMHDRGAHTISPPKGTAKVDVQYSCVRPIRVVLDVIG